MTVKRAAAGLVAPTGFDVLAHSDKFELTWTPPAGAMSYEAHTGLADGAFNVSWTTDGGATTGTVIQASDTFMIALGTRYKFRLRACATPEAEARQDPSSCRRLDLDRAGHHPVGRAARAGEFRRESRRGPTILVQLVGLDGRR